MRGAKVRDERLYGLDLARLIAFVGMVVVNFNLVMGFPALGESLAHNMIYGLEGRAAASFVTLAGVGLGLAFKSGVKYGLLAKRAAFLFAVGMVNMLIFPADIIHFYAIYFLFAAGLLTLNSRGLWLAIVGINVAFMIGLLFLNYDAGWDWNTNSYQDFWTIEGFLRNLLLNGWHPVFPWLSFLAFGIWLSRQVLSSSKVQWGLAIGGVPVYTITHFVSSVLQQAMPHPELAVLFGTEPIPPTPLYMLAGASGAALLIGVCLLLAPVLTRINVLRFVLPAGQQTLTLYIAHIVIGMGLLEALGMLENQPVENVWFASLTFCIVAIIFAYYWSSRFDRGPMETLMRKICG